MSEAEIYDELETIFRGIFHRDGLRLTADMAAQDIPGWDSFRMVEIIISVEDRFDITMEEHDLDNLRNVGDLARRIMDKIARQAAHL
jgi:acyl carrier protein